MGMKSRSKRFFPVQEREPRPRTDLNIELNSLMFPAGKPSHPPTGAAWEADLGLDELARALARDRRYLPFIRQTLATLTTDTAVIAWRQAVLADFIDNPRLVERVAALLPRLADLREGRILLGQQDRNLLLETADRLTELDQYTEIVAGLHEALQQADLRADALITLRANLRALLEDENFQALRLELPRLRAPMENIASLTVGINLDADLQPVSAVLLSINERQMGEAVSLLERLIGARSDEHDETGIAPLHFVPREPETRQLSPLFQDLDRLLTQVAQPVARALNRYVRTGTRALASIESELAFFISAVELTHKLARRGVPFCKPDIAPLNNRVSDIHHLVNIHLALRQEGSPVPSHVEFGDGGRIAVLTGPNSGGKTTYLRSVGLAQVLFQAGLFVPAERACMSPVDVILTHFPALETRQQGRLAEEAERLRDIFRQASPYSLVLLNETFSSTASGEALYLAHDILCGLRAIGLRAVYATHLTELADRLHIIEAAVEGASRLFCLVAGVQITGDGHAKPTFQINRGLPLGRSYAQEIAKRHGISLEQILDSYRARANGQGNSAGV